MDQRTIVAAAVTVPVLLLTYVVMSCFRKPKNFKGQHVFVIGGSQGIGLSLAKQLYLREANVTIAARTRTTLDNAVRQIQSTKGDEAQTGSIQAVELDVANHQQVSKAIELAETRFGNVDVAICCAGAAYTGRFIEQDIDLFDRSMQLIYFGALHVAKAVLPSMVKRKSGSLLFIISPLAAIGFVGYAAYAPAKCAVRGLADVLRNELAGTGVTVSLGYPLDTDTPGFAQENLTKPPETEAITRFAGGDVYTADKIAESLIKGLERGEYHIRTPEFLVNLLISSVSNVTPRSYPLLLEMILAPIVVLLLRVYRSIIDNFVIRERRKHQS